jgi:hypothetical protein
MGREQGALKWVMTNTPTDAPLLLWLTPALLALLLYGLGQGFVKMWITEVPPARFCLYFACARAVVMGYLDGKGLEGGAGRRCTATGCLPHPSCLVQWNALREIERNPGCSQHRLAERTFNSDQAFGSLLTLGA